MNKFITSIEKRLALESPIKSNFSIPVQHLKPESHKCVSCEEVTPFKKGKEIYDRVTKRDQFFCLTCYNTTISVGRKLRS